MISPQAPPPEILLEVDQVSHWFGKRQILNQVNLKIERGDIVSLVGPSGSGKSTLLRAILGTHPPSQGEVRMMGTSYRTPNRDRGIVYQKYSLFPFLTAVQNVALGPILDKTNLPFRIFRPQRTARFRRALRRKALWLLDQMRLGTAAHNYPSELSGGMQQRVAIAQALIMKPKLLLLDEPFGALDESTREQLQVMLLELYAQNLVAKRHGQKPPYTLLIVTHELNEAIYVSNRVLGLSQYHANGVHGATIVYDKPAPVFSPTDPKDFEIFREQREELRRVVFDPGHLDHWSKHVTYWHDYKVASGSG
jgi:NitT/TauT family transport system ATP-binding protein